MIYEFQVFYRLLSPKLFVDPAPPGVPEGPVLSLTVQCADGGEKPAEDVARQTVPADVGVITAVIRGRPIVDWSKPVFSLSEARVYLGDISAWKFAEEGRLGYLARPTRGHNSGGLYPRTALDAFVAKLMALEDAA